MEEILFVVVIALIIYLLFQNSKKNNMNNEINQNTISKEHSKSFAERQVDKTTELKILNDPNNPDNFLEINQAGEPVFLHSFMTECIIHFFIPTIHTIHMNQDPFLFIVLNTIYIIHTIAIIDITIKNINI